MKGRLFWVAPLVVALVAFAAYELRRPSDRAARLPDFTLAAMLLGKPGVARANDTGGKLRVINLFASWCLPCVAEAPELARLKAAGVPVDGIAVGDTAADVKTFLARNGDPFARVGDDKDQRVRKALGAAGVPETLVVDGEGRIVRRYVSNLQPSQTAEILALWGAR